MQWPAGVPRCRGYLCRPKYWSGRAVVSRSEPRWMYTILFTAKIFKNTKTSPNGCSEHTNLILHLYNSFFVKVGVSQTFSTLFTIMLILNSGKVTLVYKKICID